MLIETSLEVQWSSIPGRGTKILYALGVKKPKHKTEEIL